MEINVYNYYIVWISFFVLSYFFIRIFTGPSWPLSYGSWYLCKQCLSPLVLWVRISIRARCTTLCDKVCQWLATGRWFSPGPPVSSTNKTDSHDITEILLKVALKQHQTNKQTNKQDNRVVLHCDIKLTLHINSDIIVFFSIFYI